MDLRERECSRHRHNQPAHAGLPLWTESCEYETHQFYDEPVGPILVYFWGLTLVCFDAGAATAATYSFAESCVYSDGATGVLQ